MAAKQIAFDQEAREAIYSCLGFQVLIELRKLFLPPLKLLVEIVELCKLLA